jgi:outer membrane murein-binding lipoprotein Lpp
MTNLNVNGAGQVGAIDVRGMDLESALMAIQSNRANLLETQLKDQISSVQAKNDQISRLNQALGALNKAVAACFPGDAKADTRIDKSSEFSKNSYAYEREVNSALIEAGVNPDFGTNTSDGGGVTNTVDANGNAVRLPGGLRGDVTKGKLDGFIQQLKSQIDSLSNSQQMDMLRLQSLSNKRNEAFEIMTNFIKKMQDNRSSIVGNMR